METSSIIAVVGGAFVAVGVVVGLLLCRKILIAISSKQWPRVAGELHSTDLKTVRYSSREVDGTADLAQAVVTDFRYSYEVDGIRYEGHRVTFADFVNKTGGSLKTLQQRFRDQVHLEVYYNPRSPAESVLVPGVSVYNFTPLITAALFIAAGIFILGLEP